MRINPKKFLHGLLYLTPITLLALASCGGGGGGSSATLASAYTLYVSVTGISGVTGTGLVLHNGGDDLTFTAPGTKAFAYQVLSGTTYNISVLSQPVATPTQVCTVAGAVGTMPASAKTVGVNCVTGYTIGGSVNNFGAGSAVLQNNGGDNLVVGGNSNFTFNTPVAAGGNYNVTVLSNPPGFSCTPSNNTNTVPVNSKIGTVSITCTALPATPTPDQHAYVANSGSNNVWAYTVNASGVLTTHTLASAGAAPSAIAVYGGKYAFVTNRSANTVSAFGINSSGVLATSPVANTVTGNGPAAIAVHPSGKFAYVVNQLSNSISAYSINATTGALAGIDADGFTAGLQTSIPTELTPVAIAIDPAGTYAYVISLGSNTTTATVCGHAASSNGCISAYSIDASTGALTAIDATGTSVHIDTGKTPSSIAVDGTNVYVTNRTDSTVYEYAIVAGGQLIAPTSLIVSTGGTSPSSIALNPVHPSYAYVVNADSADVSVFNISGSAPAIVGGSTKPTNGLLPASISVDSTGQYAYVANSTSNDITVFNISGSGSAVSSVSCTSNCTNGNFNAGNSPISVTTSP